ncbi:MAG TPA: carbohydrate binding domain-containing protein [Chthonomonadaceae bacterium]|nr:carbohydrate binding domain-containing protein [Chthonomonadaceae bacterium]
MKRRVSGLLVAGVVGVCCGVVIACGATPADTATEFPFVLPWDDASRGTATDVSFLNATPAGVHGRIVAKEGHFVTEQNGERIRFLAVNFAATSAFPAHADAEKVAARLAKLGVNLVRLHHMDNNWGPGQNLWDWSYKDRQHLDPAQIDKLDYLISRLKAHGIYVNINLHVSREFSEADGFPAGIKSLGYAKRVDNFDRRMIALQKNYARDLLAHVNPYTHLSYTDDPCVAIVEINNENSLVGDPWATLGADLSTLPEPFRGELVGLWNDWLKQRYGTDARIRAAWSEGVTPRGPGLLTAESSWSDEHQGSSQAEMQVLPKAESRPSRTAPNIQVEVRAVDGTDWHVQTHQTGLDLKEGATYTVSFRAKADAPRSLPVTAGLDEADWHNIGLSATAALTTEWKAFHFTFAAHDVVEKHNRIAFVLGGKTGTVWLSDVSIAPGPAGDVLPEGWNLAARSFDIPDGGMPQQRADWLRFLSDTERSYANEMRAYLRDTLHVKANVICSQISWGGLMGARREAAMDFADNHSYWQHPSFPGRPWDPKDWNIPNTSQAADLAKGGGGTLEELALYRIAGKPYTISEYNEPAPNDFQAETVPILATYAAFQDWDAIYLFDYGDYGAKAANDKIQGFFGVGSNPAKTAFLPAAALLFRAGEFPVAARNEVLALPPQFNNERPEGLWKKQHGGAAPDYLHARLAYRPQQEGADAQGAGHPDVRTTAFARGAAEASPVDVFHSPGGGGYLASGEEGLALAGFVGGQTLQAKGATFAFPRFGNDFAAGMLVSLDRKPMASSQKLLLTLVGRVENKGMVWNATRTSVQDQWGNGPTLAEGIPATVTLRTDGPRHVWALDGTGRRTMEVPAAYANGALTFTVGPAQRTLWYEIAVRP